MSCSYVLTDAAGLCQRFDFFPEPKEERKKTKEKKKVCSMTRRSVYVCGPVYINVHAPSIRDLCDTAAVVKKRSYHVVIIIIVFFVFVPFELLI